MHAFQNPHATTLLPTRSLRCRSRKLRGKTHDLVFNNRDRQARRASEDDPAFVRNAVRGLAVDPRRPVRWPPLLTTEQETVPIIERAVHENIGPRTGVGGAGDGEQPTTQEEVRRPEAMIPSLDQASTIRSLPDFLVFPVGHVNDGDVVGRNAGVAQEPAGIRHDPCGRQLEIHADVQARTPDGTLGRRRPDLRELRVDRVESGVAVTAHRHFIHVQP